jgi:catechol 2,3-dioxygenase-like lactoylglutathione lyase family enzyme
MLGDKDVSVAIPAKDAEASKKFYEETLGLTKVEDGPEPGAATFKSGGCQLYVYPSQYAGTNQATCAEWKVDDIEPVVESLKGKGVKFEQYDDIPGVTREGDIHVMGDTKAVWFKDPAGNILAISS